MSQGLWAAIDLQAHVPAQIYSKHPAATLVSGSVFLSSIIQTMGPYYKPRILAFPLWTVSAGSTGTCILNPTEVMKRRVRAQILDECDDLMISWLFFSAELQLTT